MIVADWSKKPIWRRENKIGYCSIVFTWQLEDIRSLILQGDFEVDRYVVGGPAVKLMPEYLSDIAEVLEDPPIDILNSHNPLATFTTRGCPNKCSFCAVPQTEGDLIELASWDPKPIVCDNNLLAATRKHFDKVVDSLKPLKWCDFNQGLDARLFKPHHARRFAELKKPKIRFACDSQTAKDPVANAVKLARAHGLKDIGVYVLLGYKDTPEDALDRIRFIYDELEVWPNPMRFQPLKAMKKNKHVAPGWTEDKLLDMKKYWSTLRYFEAIPFEDFKRKQRNFIPECQGMLL